ncbi:MAG: hypothetical protein HY033_07725 [Ignavibacteriae bacterium]|nr:hypothetical protein [Ignavibacteria bacterium]MBI3364780.1 hypothetical protein [Ignavibacteriota bacterium]
MIKKTEMKTKVMGKRKPCRDNLIPTGLISEGVPYGFGASPGLEMTDFGFGASPGLEMTDFGFGASPGLEMTDLPAEVPAANEIAKLVAMMSAIATTIDATRLAVRPFLLNMTQSPIINEF